MVDLNPASVKAFILHNLFKTLNHPYLLLSAKKDTFIPLNFFTIDRNPFVNRCHYCYYRDISDFMSPSGQIHASDFSQPYSPAADSQQRPIAHLTNHQPTFQRTTTIKPQKSNIVK